MDLLNETVLLKTKSTLFNLLIRETSQFLCYERLLNMAYVEYKKCIFPQNAILVALLYSGFIWGPGTNYINISQESKAERNSEAIIWQMDASDWMMRLK